METQALTKAETSVVRSSDSILAVIDRAARDPSVDVGKMERLLAMASEVAARQARTAYDESMNAAQSDMRPVSRDCHNPQTRSKYASYEAIDRAIRPVYSAHGFAMSFGSRTGTKEDTVVVTCRVSHRGGHSETVELTMPADGKGARGGDVMTRTHATGSALSYGQRYLAKLIWNLSFGEHDDDGNAASPRRSEPARETPAPVQPAAPVADIKAATDKTRVWMIDQLKADKENRETVERFFGVVGAIMPGETIEELPLRFVPRTKEELKALVTAIADFDRGEVAHLPYPVGELESAPKKEPADKRPRVRGVISKVSIKNGVKKDGTPWTSYGIKIDDSWYNTFSSTIGEKAKELEGKEATLICETTERGNNAVEIE